MPVPIIDFTRQVLERRTGWINNNIGIIPLTIRHLHEVCLMLSNGFRRVKEFAKEHPIKFTLILLGITVTTISVLILPILGFSAVGPVAGSIAAGWQSSIGLVSAGSLFAFLQSAAMGGAAMAGIVGLGVAGLAIAGTTASTIIRDDQVQYIQNIGTEIGEGITKVGENIVAKAKGLWDFWGKKKLD